MDPDLHVIEDLSAYLANELDQNERSRVELHLRDCESCRKELDKHKRLNELLASSQPISPSDEIIRGVMQQVQYKQQGFSKRVLPWLALAAVLAAVLFLLKIRKETPVPGEVVKKKNPPIIKPVHPAPPVPKESPQKEIEPPPIVKNAPPKQPIVKPEQPQTIPEEVPQIVQQLNPETSISAEDEETIAKIDELENMDVISNYENLENLEVALIDEGEGSKR
jgi:hypothetical protein